MRNIKWDNIDYTNKMVLIEDTENDIISKIPIDEEFLNWMNILKQYEKALYKGQKVNNNYIIKSQIEKEEIVNYTSLNSKIYRAFESIKKKRIALTTLLNCAIIDYLYNIYRYKKLKDNQELVERIKIFYLNENVDLNKVTIIKKLYVEVTNNQNLNLLPARKSSNIVRKSKKIDVLKEISVSEVEELDNEELDEYEKDSFRNAVVKDTDDFYIIVKKSGINKYIRIDGDIVNKIKRHKWYFNINGSVITRIKKKDRLEIVYLANFILGVNKYYKIGFKNDNKFDYRKENLTEM